MVQLCRVPNCPNALLMEGPKYCSRHRICEMHVKCLRVVFDNVAYRFCQKCTRFHLIEEFDKDRHTCRDGLEQQRKVRVTSHKTTQVQQAFLSSRAGSSSTSSLYED